MGSILLQIFLLVNVFAIGVLTAIGVLHARAHFRPQKPVARPRREDIEIPPAMREKLLQQAEAHFQVITTKGASDLARKLDAASTEMVGELHKLSEEVAVRQAQTFEAARGSLDDAGKHALEEVQKAAAAGDSALEQKNSEYMQKLDAELEELGRTRREQLMTNIDAKLSDAVVSFLLETLGHDVDLGAQTKYILAQLDENKDALKAEVKA